MVFLLKFLLVISSILVVTARSPVHSVLFLIFSFCNAAALLLYIGVDFLALVYVVVYIGAIAVLFLFVVMMLNLKPQLEDKTVHVDYLYSALYFITSILIAEKLSLSFASQDSFRLLHQPLDIIAFIDPTTTMHQLGVYLFVFCYIDVFLLGLILLVSMIGTIMLTLDHAKTVRRQNPHEQNSRTSASAIRNV